ncbi:PREDICTED: uncharacterized protein LOC105362050 [Ceratosolen solmsi marchali]|uniref:Uncharacterized protein LOC105362050 n=1 Tax=Ceratosolen solmsi marchali TaxID=326594 RepID=A0AAJ6YGK0_9HYME|nr:PREDICTED: uncharacterized protein LOC105362050 [Ceratosolen solmsi marchali]
MFFSLLVFAVVLTTIFGLLHSQTAREKLYLQTFYIRSSEIGKSFLQFIGLLSEQRNTNVIELCNVLETIEPEVSNLERIISSESIQNLNNIKVEETEEPNESTSDSVENQQDDDDCKTKQMITNNHEEVFEAINASLKRLSTSANSVKVNGTQLYNLLLQEMYLHHKAMTDVNNVETTSVQGPCNEAIIEVKEVETQLGSTNQKPRMYFGESPLDYVPHQK